MTGFNHTLAGCLVAAIIPAPLAPLAAFASHFVLDAMPHFGHSANITPYNQNFIRLLVVDGIFCVLSLAYGLLLFPHLWWLMILCSATSTLPDFMWLLRGKIRRLDGFFKFAEVIQWGERPWGWMLEIIYALLFASLLYILS